MRTIENLFELVNSRNDDIDFNHEGIQHEYNRATRELTEIDGVGETVANQILDGLAIRMDFVSELSNQLDISPELNSQLTGHLTEEHFALQEL